MALSRRVYMLVALGCAVGGILFHLFISRSLPIVSLRDGVVTMADFAYHILVARAVWFEGAGSYLNPQTQQQIISTALASPIVGAMPIGVTPIGFLVWVPFAFVATFDVVISYSLWVAVSMLVLLCAAVEIGSSCRDINKRNALFLWGLLIKSTSFFMYFKILESPERSNLRLRIF